MLAGEDVRTYVLCVPTKELNKDNVAFVLLPSAWPTVLLSLNKISAGGLQLHSARLPSIHPKVPGRVETTKCFGCVRSLPLFAAASRRLQPLQQLLMCGQPLALDTVLVLMGVCVLGKAACDFLAAGCLVLLPVAAAAVGVPL